MSSALLAVSIITSFIYVELKLLPNQSLPTFSSDICHDALRKRKKKSKQNKTNRNSISIAINNNISRANVAGGVQTSE